MSYPSAPASPKPSMKAIEDKAIDESFVLAIDALNPEETSAEEKKLIRKIDTFLLPMIFFIYLLSYMDRSNIGNAKVAGMARDLELNDDIYYLAVVLFQVGYVVAEVPCNMILSKSRPSLFLPAIMVLWGTVCAAIGSVKTWQQLVAARLLLGIAEAGFAPAVMFIISSWYRKHEQSKRFVVFHAAGILSGAFGSVLSGAITDGLNGAAGLEGWRWLFILEGVTTIAFAFVVPFLMLDYPLTSKRLSLAERTLAYSRLRVDGITSRNDSPEHKLTHWEAFKISISNWKMIPLIVGYMTVVGSMSLSYFYPTIIQLMGYSSQDAQYMTAPLYGTALVIAILMCILADRFSKYRAFFAAFSLFFFGAVCSAIAAGVGSPIGRYVLLCFINTGVWCSNPLTLSYTSIVLGSVQPEVRAISLAIINGFANLAQLYGTYIFTASTAPGYVMGFAVYAGHFALGASIYLGGFFLYRRYPFQSVAAF